MRTQLYVSLYIPIFIYVIKNVSSIEIALRIITVDVKGSLFDRVHNYFSIGSLTLKHVLIYLFCYCAFLPFSTRMELVKEIES